MNRLILPLKYILYKIFMKKLLIDSVNCECNEYDYVVRNLNLTLSKFYYCKFENIST